MNQIELPVEVKEIKFKEAPVFRDPLYGAEIGDFVAVRPCADEFENKTYLGIMLGDFAISNGVRFFKETGTFEIERGHYNPMIFIPEKKTHVFGCGSWWSVIKSEEDLEQITDADIQNVWYVKAMKELAAVAKEAEPETT